MKKIVVPFAGDHFPLESIRFAGKLNESSPVLLTAVFVSEVDYPSLWNVAGVLAATNWLPPVADEDAAIEKNKARLAAYCRESGLKFVAHADRLDFALPTLRKEARFADLLVLSSLHFFEDINSRQPNAYMKDILHGTQCPVMMLPEKAMLPGSLILTYDGSPASIFAIKQFAYLFPELCATPATLTYLAVNDQEPFPEESLIKELGDQHFSNLSLLRLNLHPHDFLHDWIAGQKDPWLISGAFGRSELSMLFSASFISGLISDHNVHVFIAHT